MLLWGSLFSLILWERVRSLVRSQPFKSSFNSQNQSNLYLFWFSSLWNRQALLFFSSLSPQDPHSFSIISPLPSIHRSVLSEWTVVLSPRSFLSEPYLDISLFWGGGRITKKELRLLIEKPNWLSYFMKHRTFWRISQSILFQTRTNKLQNYKKYQVFCDRILVLLWHRCEEPFEAPLFCVY